MALTKGRAKPRATEPLQMQRAGLRRHAVIQREEPIAFTRVAVDRSATVVWLRILAPPVEHHIRSAQLPRVQ
jgi:hypothetical protein